MTWTNLNNLYESKIDFTKIEAFSGSAYGSKFNVTHSVGSSYASASAALASNSNIGFMLSIYANSNYSLLAVDLKLNNLSLAYESKATYKTAKLSFTITDMYITQDFTIFNLWEPDLYDARAGINTRLEVVKTPGELANFNLKFLTLSPATSTGYGNFDYTSAGHTFRALVPIL